MYKRQAELLGVSTTYYGEIERGNRKLTIPRILTVYEKMNLEPTYLLTGEILTDKVYDEIFDGCPREKEQEMCISDSGNMVTCAPKSRKETDLLVW